MGGGASTNGRLSLPAECLLYLAPYKMGVVTVPILSTLHMGSGAMETTREGFRYQARKGD